MQKATKLTNAQARRFILRRLGLVGGYAYKGKQGARQYISHVGALQLDPVDICGTSPDITLHSRVQGYKKPMLATLTYRERALFEYYDKNLCAIPVEAWPCFWLMRQGQRQKPKVAAQVEAADTAVRAALAEKGPLCPAQLEELGEQIHWYSWSGKTRSQAAATMEAMYWCGELTIHHRQGQLRYYHLAKKTIPAPHYGAKPPCETEAAFYTWVVKRRIAACGMLWNRGSDAWLGIPGFNRQKREAAFTLLLQQGEILPLQVEGIPHPLYCLAQDSALLAEVAAGRTWRSRCELIAPLDSFIWDRKLVEALFGFWYKWEIYTPKEQRIYGAYVLPLLWGERFAGRLQLARSEDSTHMLVKSLWLEKGVRQSARLERALRTCLGRFARFQGLAWDEASPLPYRENPRK